jgi:hypothetical protein
MDDGGTALRSETERQSACFSRTQDRHASGEKLCKRSVFNRDHYLSPATDKLGQNLREVYGSEIIHVLDRIVEENGAPPAPCE